MNDKESSTPRGNDLPDEENRPLVLLVGRMLAALCGNVRRILMCLYGVCIALVLLDLVFFFGQADKEAHYGWENGIGFYGVFGFVSCVLLVLFAKYGLRPAVMREEDYYD